MLEAVFLALLGAEIAEPQRLAALLVHRRIYYPAPLAIAATAYAIPEAGKPVAKARQPGTRPARRRSPADPPSAITSAPTIGTIRPANRKQLGG